MTVGPLNFKDSTGILSQGNPQTLEGDQPFAPRSKAWAAELFLNLIFWAYSSRVRPSFCCYGAGLRRVGSGDWNLMKSFSWTPFLPCFTGFSTFGQGSGLSVGNGGPLPGWRAGVLTACAPGDLNHPSCEDGSLYPYQQGTEAARVPATTPQLSASSDSWVGYCLQDRI